MHSSERGDRSAARQHVLVCYGDDALLRLAVRALVPASDPSSQLTKLSADSVRELVDMMRRFSTETRKEVRRGR